MAISPSTTTAAVDALLKWKNTQNDSHNPQLLPQDDFIYLVLTLKKIPQKGGINGARTNPNKIPLPHPMVSPAFSELCLIIDDRPNSKLTSEIAKKKIKSDGISISKVIKLSKLKTDYKPFESKRKLCDSYDMFFADKRVIPLLPKLLGKQFFKKKKLPLGVNLSHKNWKEQIERGCSSGLLFFRTGTCCVIRVAKVSMERDEIVENVRAAVDGVIGFVPKKLLGVRSLHLKFLDSVALPLYQSLPDIKLKIEGIQEKGKAQEIDLDVDMKEDEVSEVENNEDGDGGSDKKRKSGEVEVEVGKKKRSKRGKIDEVGSDLVIEVKAAKKGIKEKKRKGNVVEEHDVKTKSSEQIAKKKGKSQEVGKALDAGQTKSAKKSVKGVEEGGVDAKSAKKSGKDLDAGETKSAKKKRKGNAVEEVGVDTKPIDKIAKKKGRKQEGDSGKKEKKKGRSVSRA